MAVGNDGIRRNKRTVNGEEQRQCIRCDVWRPLAGFWLQGGYRRWVCSFCAAKTGHDHSSPSRAKVVARRTRQRAVAELAEIHPNELRMLMDKLRPAVEAELDDLGGHEVKLKSGQRRPGETVAERIKELCPDCATFHDAGHECPKCQARKRAQNRIVVQGKPTDGTITFHPSSAAAPTRVGERGERARRLAAQNARIMAEREAAAQAKLVR